MAKQITLQDFQDFINQFDAKLRDKRVEQSEKEEFFVMAKLVKLMEESGELADAVFNYYGFQRKSKSDTPNKNLIADEIADNFIVLSVIAKHFDLDIGDLLGKKVEKMRKRWEVGDI